MNEGANEISFEYDFPKEPGNGSKSILAIDSDGQLKDGVQLFKYNKTNERLIFVTTENGEDNDKKAVLKHTYTFTKNKFSKVKEVKTEGTNAYFIRHQFKLEKN